MPRKYPWREHDPNSSEGEENVCKAFARKEETQDEYETGELVEAAAYAQDTYGLTAVCVRAGTATPGERSGFSATNTGGTAALTLAAGGTAPDNRYQVLIEFPTGGTVGTRGITYRVSRDGGLTFGALRSLG